MNTFARTARAGLTLIELAIAAAIFATIAGIAGQSMISGTRMSAEISSSAQLADDTNRVLQRIAGQLRSADYNWIYLNEGEVSTYTFSVCTGLGTDVGGKIGPRFDNTYTIVFDSVKGTLKATLAEAASGRIISEEIASDLRAPDGFRIGQLGTDVLVKGNQLQLALARQVRLQDGTTVLREAATTIFLRSTIYANTNLTTTTTEVAAPAEEEAGGELAPIVLLGLDTDSSQKTIDKKAGVYANNLLIKGTVSMPAGAEVGINWESFALAASKESDGVSCSLALNRGWVKSENPSGKLQNNEFTITGWVVGSVTLTASATSAKGVEGTDTETY